MLFFLKLYEIPDLDQIEANQIMQSADLSKIPKKYVSVLEHLFDFRIGRKPIKQSHQPYGWFNGLNRLEKDPAILKFEGDKITPNPFPQLSQMEEVWFEQPLLRPY